MMRFERLWGTERRIFDWPHGFSLNICLFGGTPCAQYRLASKTDLQPGRSFAPQSTLMSRVASDFCAFLLTAGVITILDWVDGFGAFASKRLQPNSPVCVAPRCAALCGKLVGEFCLLSMFLKSTAVCSSATQESGSHENPENWQLTFTLRTTNTQRLRINFATEAHKF